MINEKILSCLKQGNFTLHSGQKSEYIFDVMQLIADFDFQQEFCEFVNGDFLVGVEFGGSILAMLNGNEDYAIIRKNGTIYGSLIPKDYVLLDDVVTTENSLRTAMKQLHDKIGYYPDEIKCVVDRRAEKDKSLHIESMFEITEEQIKRMKPESKNGIIEDRRLASYRVPVESIQETLHKLRQQAIKNTQKCSRCGNPLFDMVVSADVEPHCIGDNLVCKKCYFDAIGEEIEKYPIGGGGIGRRK